MCILAFEDAEFINLNQIPRIVPNTNFNYQELIQIDLESTEKKSNFLGDLIQFIEII